MEDPTEELKTDIDWTLCVLCQQKSKEPLQNPSRNTRSDTGAGYASLAHTLDKCNEYGFFPFTTTINQLDQGSGFEVSLQQNQGSWHKSCLLKINKTKLERIEKKRKSDEYQKNEAERSKKFTRLSATFPASSLCFLCDTVSEKDELRNVSTFQVDEKVRKCAHILQDQKLLAKISSGDLIALEAKYHPACLVLLYRKAENASCEDKREDETSQSHGIAFAQIVEYLNDCRIKDSCSVFRLADILKLYREQLEALGVEVVTRLHSTRLKNRLLAHFPDLEAHNTAKDVLLVFQEKVGLALNKVYKDSYDDEGLCLLKAAKIIRRDIFNSSAGVFSGSFTENCQNESVPQSLLTLVSMIMEGPNMASKPLTKNQPALTLSQLLKYNSVKKQRQASIARHPRERETPMPIYVGLKIHSLTRSRELIDSFFSLGLSVSYDRILQISTELTNDACARFESLGAVVPAKLCRGVFSTAAIDNIDHDPSSTYASSSFHGTGISIFQHPSNSQELNPIVADVSPSQQERTPKLSDLPEFYSNVPPVILHSSTVSPLIEFDHPAPSTVGHKFDEAKDFEFG